jgi:DNA-directed RNA polymerase specialized sigma24 family protein
MRETSNQGSNEQSTETKFWEEFNNHIANNPSVMAFAIKLTNDPERAKDLFQDAAYKATKNRHRYQL